MGFAREVLGVELWEGQIAIVESIRDNRNTTVRSGHKCGKSTAISVAALWFYSTFDRARVLITAVKAPQVENVIWKEIRRLCRASRRGKFPIDGELFEVARSGLKADDERQIFGLTARDGEGLAGISSPNMLVLADEASGIADKFFEVLGTSLASDGGVVRQCYISNPTRTTGAFFRSHTTERGLFNAIAISSEDTPNARGTGRIPGLAGPDWIAEKKAQYGEDSPQYRVRVKGEFAYDLEGKVISLDAIAEAQARWDTIPDEGQLQIGVDPAGDGVHGDETAIAIRRGARIVKVLAFRGITEDSIVAHVLGVLADHRRSHEPKPRVVVDVAGGIGYRVGVKLAVASERDPEAFDLVRLQGNWRANDREHEKVRDALWGRCRDFLKAGGALPEDVKLEQELNCPSWVELKNGAARVTEKDDMREELGRSPDRADAVCLATWPCPSLDAKRDGAPPIPEPQRPAAARHADEFDDEHASDSDRVFNPYGGAG